MSRFVKFLRSLFNRTDSEEGEYSDMVLRLSWPGYTFQEGHEGVFWPFTASEEIEYMEQEDP